MDILTLSHLALANETQMDPRSNLICEVPNSYYSSQRKGTWTVERVWKVKNNLCCLPEHNIFLYTGSIPTNVMVTVPMAAKAITTTALSTGLGLLEAVMRGLQA